MMVVAGKVSYSSGRKGQLLLDKVDSLRQGLATSWLKQMRLLSDLLIIRQLVRFGVRLFSRDADAKAMLVCCLNGLNLSQNAECWKEF